MTLSKLLLGTRIPTSAEQRGWQTKRPPTRN